MARTHPVILDHLNGIRNAIIAGGFNFPIEQYRRPQDGDMKYVDPPYLVLRTFPSADQTDGPLSDSDADIILRFQTMGVGFDEDQAINIVDRVRPRMQRELITITGRRVMDVRGMIVTGGANIDNNLPTPFYYSHDIWEVWTTPSSS
jgi:hypothetical protein